MCGDAATYAATCGDVATCVDGRRCGDGAPVSIEEERRKQNEWPPKKGDLEDAFNFN
jgi:hypothetical protein